MIKRFFRYFFFLAALTIVWMSFLGSSIMLIQKGQNGFSGIIIVGLVFICFDIKSIIYYKYKR